MQTYNRISTRNELFVDSFPHAHQLLLPRFKFNFNQRQESTDRAFNNCMEKYNANWECIWGENKPRTTTIQILKNTLLE